MKKVNLKPTQEGRMRNSLKYKKKMVGSTGIEPATPTVSRLSKKAVYQAQKLEPEIKYVIPEGFSLIPGIEWKNGRARIFHVLCKNVIAGREKVVISRRSKRRAA